MSPPAQDSDRAFIERSVRRGIVGVSVAAVLLALLWLLEAALTPLVVAFVFAYLFDPLIDRFENRRVSRRLVIFSLLGLTALGLLAFALFVVPRMLNELAGASQRLPGYLDGALTRLAPLADEYGVTLPGSLSEGVEALRSGEVALPFATVRDLLQRALRFFTGTLGAMVGLAVVPVIAYYLLVDFDRVKRSLLGLVPRGYQTRVAERARTVDGLIAGFFRGQLTVCLILGALYALGFSVIGVDLAFVIGFAAGALAIIPYLGNLVAIATASGLCVLEFGVDAHLAMTVGWYAVVQTLDGTLLTPRIVGGSVGMHPVTVIVALLIGGDLLGFLGLLVAVPLAAVAQVFLRDALDAYRRSSLYTGETDGGAPPA